MEHHITNDMIERVIRSRATAGDEPLDSGKVWYLDTYLRAQWGDEFIAMHDLAEALRECRTDRAALLAVAKAAVLEMQDHATLAMKRGHPCDCGLCAAVDALPEHLRRECQP